MEASTNLYLFVLSVISFFLYLLQRHKSASQPSTASEKLFQLQLLYLPPHLLAIFADWLQGPYVFQLYKHYGHADEDIAVFFLAGYLSSCIFGTLTGPLADLYGRKLLAQVIYYT